MLLWKCPSILPHSILDSTFSSPPSSVTSCFAILLIDNSKNFLNCIRFIRRILSVRSSSVQNNNNTHAKKVSNSKFFDDLNTKTYPMKWNLWHKQKKLQHKKFINIFSKKLTFEVKLYLVTNICSRSFLFDFSERSWEKIYSSYWNYSRRKTV